MSFGWISVWVLFIINYCWDGAAYMPRTIPFIMPQRLHISNLNPDKICCNNFESA
jgi:hypothetical protein